MSETNKVPVTLRLWGRAWDDTLKHPTKEVEKLYEQDVKFETLQKSVQKSCFGHRANLISIEYSQDDTIQFRHQFSMGRLKEAFVAYLSQENVKIYIDVVKAWPSFPNPFNLEWNMYGRLIYGDNREPKSRVELRMMKLSAAIRRKTFWFKKMHSTKITKKWISEAQMGFTDQEMNYVLQELKFYDSLRIPELGIEVSDVDGVWHSDVLIDGSLDLDLKKFVKVFEKIPESQRDWHPGSKNQVLDLVHPSLYPITYGRTRVIEPGEVVEFPSDVGYRIKNSRHLAEAPELSNPQDFAVSTKFCWLPAEFKVEPSGEVKIESYINNLHPITHKGLYACLEKIFAKFVPLFECVLDNAIQIRENRVKIPDDPDYWYEGTGPDDPMHWKNREKWLEGLEKQMVDYPVPPEIFEPPTFTRELSLLGSQLQVVVKIASIILTADNPVYPGGVWHVEGMRNEHIVATGIYYFDVENISESELSFRQSVTLPGWDHGHDHGCQEMFGIAESEPLNQVLGSVLTKEGRCVAFPNTYQHRVAPFELRDKGKPGHRKILVFFLVDPGTRILSSLTIPPQQKDWHPSNTKSTEGEAWPISIEEAKQLRLELMDERKYFVHKQTEEIFERPFSLCEH